MWLSAWRIASISVPTPIRCPAPAASRTPLAKPGLHRLDHRLQRQPAPGAQLGRVTDLGVHDTVGGQVEHGLRGDPLQRLLPLQHRDGVRERLEVAHQGTRRGRGDEPGRQLRGVGAGQLVAHLVGQLDERAGAQAAVEVVVQQDLGCGEQVDGAGWVPAGAVTASR
jgi:hypothetical protein